MSLPLRLTSPSGVTTGSSLSSNPGESSSGTLKLRPSSPPVKSDSCEASVRKAEATASVIMAKKIAFTRNENSPISSDSTTDTTSAHSTPSSSTPQEASSTELSAIATP